MKNKNSKRAVIIKGNPLYIEHELAKDFYNELCDILTDLRFEVLFDEGKPFTVPEPADLWIGHSRGTDRLRFAPKETHTIGIGVPFPSTEDTFVVINHPNDTLVKEFEQSKSQNLNLNDPGHVAHFQLTEEMKESLIKLIESYFN